MISLPKMPAMSPITIQLMIPISIFFFSFSFVEEFLLIRRSQDDRGWVIFGSPPVLALDYSGLAPAK
jgi:hypothetical protein